MALLLEELGSKLSDIVGIKVSFPFSDDKELILKIYSRLCLLYDDTWDLEGSTMSCKKIQRLLNLVGIGHLCHSPTDVTDRRRLPRIWSAFIASLEQKYGSHGLYSRLRKVLKQQQILAARRGAERDRLQRGAGSARSPGRTQLADASSCSTLSQASQESFRFAKPQPPATVQRRLSSSSTSSSSPTRAGRSRIPVAQRYNVIPTGRQLARTPSLNRALPAAAAAPASPAPVRPVHPRLSQLVVANKRLSDSGNVSYELSAVPVVRRSVDESPTSAAGSDGSPPQRRPLAPASKTPEQELGEYIEHRLNAHFPHDETAAAAAETEPEDAQTAPPAAQSPSLGAQSPSPAGQTPPPAAQSPSPATQTPPAAAQSPSLGAQSPSPAGQTPPPAAQSARLNVTYSAERPAAGDAERPAPSPAGALTAGARDEILLAAGEPAQERADADKENVRPADTERPAKTGDESDGEPIVGRADRRDTFEVASVPAAQKSSATEPPAVKPLEGQRRRKGKRGQKKVKVAELAKWQLEADTAAEAAPAEPTPASAPVEPTPAPVPVETAPAPALAEPDPAAAPTELCGPADGERGSSEAAEEERAGASDRPTRQTRARGRKAAGQPSEDDAAEQESAPVLQARGRRGRRKAAAAPEEPLQQESMSSPPGEDVEPPAGDTTTRGRRAAGRKKTRQTSEPGAGDQSLQASAAEDGSQPAGVATRRGRSTRASGAVPAAAGTARSSRRNTRSTVEPPPAADLPEQAETERAPRQSRRGRPAAHLTPPTKEEAAAKEEADAAPAGGRRRRLLRLAAESDSEAGTPMDAGQPPSPAVQRGRRGRKTADPPPPIKQKAADPPPPIKQKAAAEEAGAEPAPPRGGRRRLLRLVPESDSEAGTPPDGGRPPSPAVQRGRRGRKTAAGAGRPRRALRAVENCE